jgi:hypothetical protein
MAGDVKKTWTSQERGPVDVHLSVGSKRHLSRHRMGTSWGQLLARIHEPVWGSKEPCGLAVIAAELGDSMCSMANGFHRILQGISQNSCLEVLTTMACTWPVFGERVFSEVTEMALIQYDWGPLKRTV